VPRRARDDKGKKADKIHSICIILKNYREDKVPTSFDKYIYKSSVGCEIT
jgi:hypothetical protein